MGLKGLTPLRVDVESLPVLPKLSQPSGRDLAPSTSFQLKPKEAQGHVANRDTFECQAEAECQCSQLDNRRRRFGVSGCKVDGAWTSVSTCSCQPLPSQCRSSVTMNASTDAQLRWQHCCLYAKRADVGSGCLSGRIGIRAASSPRLQCELGGFGARSSLARVLHHWRQTSRSLNCRPFLDLRLIHRSSAPQAEVCLKPLGPLPEARIADRQQDAVFSGFKAGPDKQKYSLAPG